MGQHDSNEQLPPPEAALFRLMVENVRDFAIFALALDGRVSTWNPGAERVFGWSEQEILGQDVSVLFTPDDRAAGVPQQEMADAREKGRAEDERWHVRKDGSRFFASGVMTPIRDGLLHGYAKVCRDVTDRVRAAEALRASEDRHRFLADLAATIHPLTDPDEIMAVTARRLGEHLDVDRCAYAEVEDESVYVITGDHTRGVPSIVGRWPVAAFGAEHHRMMKANEPYVVDDADADPRIGPEHLPSYRATDIQSVICLPLHKGGRFTAAMAVHQKLPRRWTDDEVALVRVVVGRCWEALERARVERTLRASEERLRRMVNVDVVGVLVWALPAGRLVGANDYFLRMFGYTRAEVEAGTLTWRDLTPPEYVAASEAQLEGFAATGRIGPYEKEYFRKDQSRAWMAFAGASLGDGTVVEYCIDVSDRKRAEERVRDSEERLKLALGAARMGIWTLDVATGAHTRDANLNRLLGVEAAETTQPFEAFLSRVHPADREAVRATFGASAREGRRLSLEFRVVWPDGTVRWLRDQGDVFQAGGGGRLHMTGACVDVTDRREAEEALRRKEGELTDFVENATVGLHWVGPDGTILWANKAELDLLGYTREEYVGRNIAEFHADPSVIDDILCRLTAGEELHGYEARLKCKDDSVRHVMISSNVYMENGEFRHTRCFTRDVTDRKQAEERLRDEYRRKDEFMAMLAHELRNPLAPLRNALQILSLRGGDAGVVGQVRGMMERQVVHLGRLVDDLLDVSRITTGKVQLRKERLDSSRLVRQAVADHRATYEAKGVSLAVATPDAPVWVSGDPTRLAQILDNLLTNALKFTARDGEVAVSVAPDPDKRASLTVRDTGAGIEPEMLSRLFEPFSQADRTLDRSAGGLGLGLAIVRGLAELHGGSVRAESKGLGQGATFTVTLPAYAEPPALASQPATPRRAVRRLRILVVEDNKDAADSLRMLLEAYGYEVEVAYSGPDGVRAAEAYRPEVVICDIGLPGMDGYAVAAALRGNPGTASSRLIALTGYGQDEDRRRAKDAGFDEHLTKPADPATLEALIAAAG